MKRIDSVGRRLGYRMVAVLALLGAAAARPAQADAVTDWNAIMQTTVASTNPVGQTRASAIVQLAVFEAVNAITGEYEPYLGTISAPAWASPEAAAVSAAYSTLVTMYPASAPALDAARAASLAAIPGGPAKDAGVAVGEAAAAAMLLRRANDGSATAGSVPYTPGTAPGDWRPAPPALAPAFLVGWGQITPFGLTSGDQFRMPPPPALQTGRYENDFNEVKAFGRFDSPLRPQDRTDVARFYAVTLPTQLWNDVARQAVAAEDRTLSENARLFALVAMALADSAIATWDNKFYYGLWRPVTAIRDAALDGNARTEPDPDWLPLIPTPPYPSYVSAHASLSGAARGVLEHLLGKSGHSITLTNPNPAVSNIVLSYADLRQITDDIDDARVYGGIHFRFDQEAGAHQGKLIAHYLLRNYLRPAYGQGVLTDLGTLVGSNSLASAINGRARVARWSCLTDGASFHSLLGDEAGALRDPGTRGGDHSRATDAGVSSHVTFYHKAR